MPRRTRITRAAVILAEPLHCGYASQDPWVGLFEFDKPVCCFEFNIGVQVTSVNFSAITRATHQTSRHLDVVQLQGLLQRTSIHRRTRHLMRTTLAERQSDFVNIPREAIPLTQRAHASENLWHVSLKNMFSQFKLPGMLVGANPFPTDKNGIIGRALRSFACTLRHWLALPYHLQPLKASVVGGSQFPVSTARKKFFASSGACGIVTWSRRHSASLPAAISIFSGPCAALALQRSEY